MTDSVKDRFDGRYVFDHVECVMTEVVTLRLSFVSIRNKFNKELKTTW